MISRSTSKTWLLGPGTCMCPRQGRCLHTQSPWKVSVKLLWPDNSVISSRKASRCDRGTGWCSHEDPRTSTHPFNSTDRPQPEFLIVASVGVALISVFLVIIAILVKKNQRDRHRHMYK